MKLAKARISAEWARAVLAPHCERIEIAGSVRRRKAECGDIEIVAIPKPYDVGLFASGIATVVEDWRRSRGELSPGSKYLRRMLPDGTMLNLFFARPENWGYIFAIRTGSADFSHNVLARGWVANGYHGKEGMLWKYGTTIEVREERDLFALAGVPWVEPEKRT